LKRRKGQERAVIVRKYEDEMRGVLEEKEVEVERLRRLIGSLRERKECLRKGKEGKERSKLPRLVKTN
jgi:hypothetical protein